MSELKSKQKLKIHPTPFKPSHLSIPPSPFSPQTPLILPSNRPAIVNRKLPTPDALVPAPPSPLHWVWTCHQCNHSYALGVTRRCLHDGHFFCSGTTTVKNWRKSVNPRKIKRHRACDSEFDYQGWKDWGRWKRSGMKDSIHNDYDSSSSSWSSSSSSSPSSSFTTTRAASFRCPELQKPKQKDCWNTCDYPSKCRWDRQIGVHTPLVSQLLATSTIPPLPPKPSEGVLEIENVKSNDGVQKAEKLDFWRLLFASATRSIPPSSPLTNIPETPEAELETSRSRGGDVVMSTSAPVAAAENLAASAPVVKVKNIIKKNSKRREASPLLERKPPTKPDPVAQLPPTAASNDNLDLVVELMEDISALASLERVQSRGSRCPHYGRLS
ncbi:hypothetical protein CC78DRAFT_575887 [Lojkania enalia]|uniref:Uncharacterized protein n=1 Tax=Lojkania enalia TaxID=147567 RepID=A0A9P4KH01_9PLEO|nr:hypothetical protein CC78DRAFT_575887 [Didymosphaeria enalia]